MVPNPDRFLAPVLMNMVILNQHNELKSTFSQVCLEGSDKICIFLEVIENESDNVIDFLFKTILRQLFSFFHMSYNLLYSTTTLTWRANNASEVLSGGYYLDIFR